MRTDGGRALKLFPKYDGLTIERTAAKVLLATTLFVVLGMLMLGCAPVHASRPVRASDQSCVHCHARLPLSVDTIQTASCGRAAQARQL